MRFVLVATLLLSITLSGQELIPGTARPIVDPNAPTSTSGYICPMHPNEVKAEPGKCSICGMTLVPGDPMATADYRMSVVAEPRVVKPGQKTKFKFTITHPLTGQTVQQFADVHDKPYHLFIVSRDMTLFDHVHPVFEKDGSFTIEHTLPKAGHYVFFSDFMPVGGGPQLIATPIVTAGYEGDVASDAPNLVADKSWVKSADGVTVDLRIEPAKLVSGDQLDVPIHFTDAKTDEPVKDLQRYLGAFGHAMMLSEDMMEYVHAHPEETLEGTTVTEGGGPDLTFHALFPRPGHYRIWLQFLRNNKLSTVPFTVRVLRAGETAEKQ